MIPLRLHLRNFLSYGDATEPIDFSGIHVACLCGPNGHGKSALLDAITWALWGQARTNTADHLIRLGQGSMLVELDFRLEGREYRVVRKRAVGRTSQSDLQLQMCQDDGAWRALSDQSVRGTQERISALLRMDYETFINSALILQGRADEFARKTPGERKRILGEILNLGVYDQLCESARAHRQHAAMRLAALDAEIAHKQLEYARLPELRADAARLESEHADARVRAAETQVALQEVVVEKTRLDARRRERDDLTRRLEAGERDLRTLRNQLAAVRGRVDAGTRLVVRAAEIRARAGELMAVATERDRLTTALRELRDLESERETLRRRMDEERSRLATRQQIVRQQIAELRAQVDTRPQLLQRLHCLERDVAELDQKREERAGLQSRLQELAAARAEAQAQQQRCGEELHKAEERFLLLKDAGATCPICEGELPDNKRIELGRALRAEKTLLKTSQEEAFAREQAAARSDSSTRRQLEELESALRNGQHTRDGLARARQQNSDLDAAATRLTEFEEQARIVDAELARGEFAAELRAALDALTARIDATRYDDQRHRELTRRAGELAGVEKELHALEAAEAGIAVDRDQADALTATIQAREEELTADRSARAEAERDLSGATHVEAEAARLHELMALTQSAEAEAGRRSGAVREALRRCEELGPVLARLKESRQAAAMDQAAFDDLSRAFGRNGVQALIVENELPEIEREANALLSRMSDGQLVVSLDSQKALKSGGQAETLEIKISDTAGSRSYELYSGGEQFRVNFALRIALSKVLARRSGARLETLVVDEGFGSQDQEGRERLVEAIQSVQDDFALILVITHIDELKDRFPTRIEVTKSLHGSQVAVY